MDMGWITIIASALTFLVGFIIKNIAYQKVLSVLADVAEVVSDYNKAQADGKIDPEEAKELIEDIQHMVAEFKK